MLKKIKLFISCIVKIYIAKQDYLAYTNYAWRFWRKMPRQASAWFVNATKVH
jgi:hypothetical protein